MADRYQDRPFGAGDDYDRDAHAQPARAESDPLAELARLIGQTDPFAMGRANQPMPRGPENPSAPAEDVVPAGPPPWMRRATLQPAPAPLEEDEAPVYPSAVHPLHRYATPVAAPEPDYHPPQDYQPQYAADHEPDPARYDDALYGQIDSGAQAGQHDPAYADDAYAYQDGYDEPQEPARKRGGMMTVVMVLALAVVGTGGAYAYRTYLGSSRSGEAPIIRADPSPTKVVPTPADGSPKVPDRMAVGDGKEKIVPREEAPVDVNARSGPRVVFPPLNANNNPPPVATVAPAGPPPIGTGNGTLPSNEPRKITTIAVRGNQPDAAAVPVAAPPPAAKPAPAPKAAAPAAPPAAPATRSPPSSANASANAPLSLTPQAGPTAAEPRARVALNAPGPAPAPAAPAGGSYLVSVSSQPSEAAAQSSYRVLQGKYPAVLGSRSATIKRAELGEKVVYRAMIGPFASADEAKQFCGSLTAAGGQCFIPRN